MRAVDVIQKKKVGGHLTPDEIKFFIGGYVKGEVPDYQMAALLMAVYFQGMDIDETVALTEVMRDSGDQVDLKGIKGIKVDKHSTGGVGDKTTLALTPILASCGLKVAKMSGRGLGHTGGTLDKLEAIAGFDINLDAKRFRDVVNRHGIAVVGQTGSIVPADKKIYSLRDVTATVDNVSLIASSIMSKKLAVANDALVLDVKTGSGAFMKTLPESRRLARIMVDIGLKMGRKIRAVITDMNQPLGRAVGNANEVREAVETLEGHGPADFQEVVFALATHMFAITGLAKNEKAARALCQQQISSGAALRTFKEFLAAQGGDPELLHDLPTARRMKPFKAARSGFLSAVDCEGVGLAVMKLGAGRATKDDVIDHAVGFEILVKIGDRVKAGDALVEIHYNDERRLAAAEEQLATCFTFSAKKPKVPPTVYDVIK